MVARRGARVLRLLLWALSRAERERHGDELLAFWSAQRSEARYRGARGRVRYLIRVAGDALTMGVRARFESERRGGGSAFTQDVRHAARALAGAPLFTTVSVATLALGIGATAGLFTVVRGVLLRPLPYPAPERLVRITRVDREGSSRPDAVGWLDFRDWRERLGGFDGMAAYTEDDAIFGWEGGAESLTGARITRDLFDVVRVPLLLGRTFTDAEDRSGGPDAVILSHALWRERFGSDPGILGRTIPIEGEAVPVVGVAPAGFAFPTPELAYWRPLQDEQLLIDLGLPAGTRTLSFLTVVGRLGGSDREAAEAALVALATRIDREAGKSPPGAVRVVSLLQAMVADVRTTLAFLLAAVSLVWLVACANVSSLALGRVAAREREMAVRRALGAGRARLFGLLLTESLVLSAAAGAAAAALTWALVRLLVHLAPPGLPRLAEIRVDGPVLLFGAGVTALSGLLFGVVPALASARRDPDAGLLAGTRGASAGRAALRPQRALVVFQVALSVVLLAAAALLAHSFARLARVERGFRTDGVVLALVVPGGSRLETPADTDAFYEELLGRVRALPGVVAATSTYSPPLAANDFATGVAPEGADSEDDEPIMAGTVIVRDDYFETTGVRLLRGRDFGAGDRLGAPPVAIVSETMARTLWPGEDPLGRRFVFTGGLSGSADSFDPAFFPDEPFTVVGVAGDVRRQSLAEPPRPEYYRPHAQITWASQYLVVRTRDDPDPVAARMRATVWSLDPTVAVESVRTLAAQVAESVATPRFRVLLLGAFALVTGVLAMVGLYAVVALSVARRTREMGIRLALGAERGALVRGVVAGGLRLVLVGIAVGLAIAWAGSGVLASMLFEVAPTDPATYAAVGALTAVVAVLACWVPARRASRVDPTRSLREE
jgi:predicted permease